MGPSESFMAFSKALKGMYAVLGYTSARRRGTELPTSIPRGRRLAFSFCSPENHLLDCRIKSLLVSHEHNVGPLMIRIGFWEVYSTINIARNPPK